MVVVVVGTVTDGRLGAQRGFVSSFQVSFKNLIYSELYNATKALCHYIYFDQSSLWQVPH